MTQPHSSADANQPASDLHSRADAEQLPQIEAPHGADDAGIVSVNQNKSQGNKSAKAAFLLISGLLLVGALVWFGQNYLTNIKNSMRAGSAGKKANAEQEDLLNPEGSKQVKAPPKLGPQRVGLPGAAASAPPLAPVVATEAGCEGIPGARALRGSDGQVMTNPQGRALCIGADGKVVSVPAIQTVGGNTGGGGQASQKPASRFGGSLFADGGRSSAYGDSAGSEGSAGDSASRAKPTPGNPNPQKATSTQQNLELLRSLMPTSSSTGAGGVGSSLLGGGAGGGAPAGAQAQPAAAGTVGGLLNTSSTPLARASRLADQNLMLPKSRQIDCVLTGRIVNDVPGFTSCALTHDLYSSNGSVKLLEKGSALDGEYGSVTQNGQQRLFVVWDRIRTPDGVQIDLKSPGTDALGTSGIPGYLDNRWTERLGTALLISLMNDAFALQAAKQAAANSGGGTVVLSQGGGQFQSTQAAGQSMAEQVLRQTINVKPTLYINEGERIAIYVARDLDFSGVYALRTAGRGGALRLQ